MEQARRKQNLNAGRDAKKRGSTTEQLRRDIDSGRTASKVNAIDPAAAPLGTDEEAAGTPVSPETVQAARESETGTGNDVDRRKREINPAVPTLAVFFAIVLALIAATWGATNLLMR